eukprot:gene7442-5240_t
MKLLHSKTLSEPILLLSACPSMYLIAVVTARQVIVFRSTTMAPVLTRRLGLDPNTLYRAAPGNAQRTSSTCSSSSSAAATPTGSSLSACWSPAGRIFVLSLPHGTILLLDVETGELIRRLVPKGAPLDKKVYRCAASAAEEDDDAEDDDDNADEEEEEQETSKNGPADTLEDGHIPRRVLQQLYAVRSPISISIAACPVVAMSWARIVSPYPTILFHQHAGRDTCLPLYPGLLSSLLLEELVQPLHGGGWTPSSSADAAAGDTDAPFIDPTTPDAPNTVSLLFILDEVGHLSIVLGGLHEVFACRWSLPTHMPFTVPTVPSTRGTVVGDDVVDGSGELAFGGVRVRHMAVVAHHSSSSGDEQHSARHEVAEEAEDGASKDSADGPCCSHTGNLFVDTAAFLAALGEPLDPTVATAAARDRPSSTVLPGVTPSNPGEHHSLLLILQPLHPPSVKQARAGTAGMAHEYLLQLPLRDVLRALLSPEMVAQCCLQELHRIASSCYRRTTDRYYQAYAALLQAVGLPENAAALKQHLLDVGDPDVLAEYFDALFFSSPPHSLRTSPPTTASAASKNAGSLSRGASRAARQPSAPGAGASSGNPPPLAKAHPAAASASPSAESITACWGVPRIAKAEMEFRRACAMLQRDLVPVCYGCYETAMAIAKAHGEISVTSGAASRARWSTEMDAMHADGGNIRETNPSPSLRHLLGALRHRCELLLRHVAQEQAIVTEVLQWLVFILNAEPILFRVLEFHRIREAAAFASGDPPPPPPVQRHHADPLPSHREPFVFEWLQRADRAHRIAEALRREQQQRGFSFTHHHRSGSDYGPAGVAQGVDSKLIRRCTTPWGVCWELDTARLLHEASSATTLFTGAIANPCSPLTRSLFNKEGLLSRLEAFTPPTPPSPIHPSSSACPCCSAGIVSWCDAPGAPPPLCYTLLPNETLDEALERSLAVCRRACTSFAATTPPAPRLCLIPAEDEEQQGQAAVLWEYLSPADLQEAADANNDEDEDEEEEGQGTGLNQDSKGAAPGMGCVPAPPSGIVCRGLILTGTSSAGGKQLQLQLRVVGSSSSSGVPSSCAALDLWEGCGTSALSPVELEDESLNPALLHAATPRAFSLLPRNQYLVILTGPDVAGSSALPPQQQAKSAPVSGLLILAMVDGNGALQLMSSSQDDEEADAVPEVEKGVDMSSRAAGDEEGRHAAQDEERDDEDNDADEDEMVPAVLKVSVDPAFVGDSSGGGAVVPLLWSVSREKEFGVLSCGNKFLVVDFVCEPSLVLVHDRQERVGVYHVFEYRFTRRMVLGNRLTVPSPLFSSLSAPERDEKLYFLSALECAAELFHSRFLIIVSLILVVVCRTIMGLSATLERLNARAKVQTMIHVTSTAYQIVKASLWPVFSTGILLSAFNLICLSSEKQIIADHYYGDADTFEAEKTELLAESKRLFQEELSTAIKEHVWQMPQNLVEHAFRERNIFAILDGRASGLDNDAAKEIDLLFPQLVRSLVLLCFLSSFSFSFFGSVGWRCAAPGQKTISSFLWNQKHTHTHKKRRSDEDIPAISVSSLSAGNYILFSLSGYRCSSFLSLHIYESYLFSLYFFLFFSWMFAAHWSNGFPILPQLYLQAMSFEEILDAEVAVNMFKLREASRLGIPAMYRGTVYRYLLGVTFGDKSSEMMVERDQDKEFRSLVLAHEKWKHTGHIRVGPTSGGYVLLQQQQRGEEGLGSFLTLRPGGEPALLGGLGAGLYNAGSAQRRAAAAMSLATGPLASCRSVREVQVEREAEKVERWGDAPMKVNPRTAWEVVVQTVHNRYSSCPDSVPLDPDARMPMYPSSSSSGTAAAHAAAGTGAASTTAAAAAPGTAASAAVMAGAAPATDRERRQKMMLVFAALQMSFSEMTLESFLQVIHLTLPLEPIFNTAKDLFFCARALVHVLTHHRNILQDSTCKQHHCGNFLMLFRAVNAPLYKHFYREQVTVSDWVPDILSSLLTGFVLHQGDLLSLWDHYLADVSTHQGFPLHPYVCLAILMELTEELIECDREEILYRLRHLPRLDVPGLLRKAVAIQQSTSGLVEEYY